MSLVAYAGSDESDEEEQETEAVASTSPKMNEMSGHISDEEDHFAGVSSSTVGTSYASIFSAIDPDTGEANQSESRNETTLTALDGLPAPKQKQGMEEVVPQETELEDEVLPKAAELADAPKPPPKKQRQPAKISIPSLNDVDEAEESCAKSKSKPSDKPSGLFSLLPAPVHSSKKEINRPLIPHTLTKKNASVKKETQVKEISSSLGSNLAPVPSGQSQSKKNVSRKHLTTFNALTGYDSDSDEEDNVEGSSHNFFSLGQNSQSVSSNKSKASDEQAATVDSTVEVKEKEAVVDDEEVDSSETVEVARIEPGAINDAPLDFSSTSKLHSWTHTSFSHLQPVGPSTPYGSVGMPTANSQLAEGNASYYDPTTEEEHLTSYSSTVTSEDLQQLMTDKDFQRIQGKKRKRGMEEEINFVDARVDDYVDPSEVSKHMTEETEYVSTKKDKDNMPTAQQKRKKQITYLAYQAKEKEFELKNTWAQNRQTKKQTQSKYGF